MPFVKIQKTKAYFKRFQVAYRRRRNGKTDYRRRIKMVSQFKNKYASPKYRFVVRFTNKDIVCQVVRSKLVGDFVEAAAYAHELPKYGLKVGLTNYAAAYCTGLLCARRILTKFKLADMYKGQAEVNGEDYLVEAVDDGPNPFFALLDVGLRRTTTGARVFSALKGACDGGVEIPHSESRFVGYDSESKKFAPEVLKSHIFGGHVAAYMAKLKESDEGAFKRQFSQYIAVGVKGEDLEALYKKVHAAIRKDPVAVKKVPKKHKDSKKTWKKVKHSYADRKNRLKLKFANWEKKHGSVAKKVQTAEADE